MEKEGQMETTRTLEERIEQAAHDIIASCEIIKSLAADVVDSDDNATKGYRRWDGFPEMARVYSAARSAQFHAEYLISSELERLEL
jgi:hypothetical protein